MKKILLFFRLNILYMFRNKVRFALTMTGITIGLLVYMLGNVAVNGYIDSLYEDAYNFDGNSLLVYDEEGKTIDRIRDFSEKFQINRCHFMLDSYATDKDYFYGNVTVSNSIDLVGMDSGITGAAVPYMQDNVLSVARTRLLYGRDFSEEDIQNGTNAVIVEKSTAIFWFQKENAVGEYVDVLSPYGYDRFVVIGVIDDLPARKNKNMEFNKTVQQDKVQEFSNSSAAYATYKYLESMAGKNTMQEWYTVNTAGETEVGKIDSLVEGLNERTSMYGSSAAVVVSQRTRLAEVSSLERTLRGFINAIIAVLIAISGFMIVTIYVFSVKERTYEIGIRRALGASEFDIVFQFIWEGITTALAASAITLLAGAVLCNLATSYLVGKLYMDIKLVFTGELMISVVGLAVLQGIVFCFVPALIASKIRPTEAVRWD